MAVTIEKVKEDYAAAGFKARVVLREDTSHGVEYMLAICDRKGRIRNVTHFMERD